MTCAFVMMRPITNARLLLSQRMVGCNRAPLWHFLTPERRNSAIRMRGNQRQSSNQHQAFKMRLKGDHAHQASKKQASRGGGVRKRWHHKCAIDRQSRTRRCATMNELLRGQECYGCAGLHPYRSECDPTQFAHPTAPRGIPQRTNVALTHMAARLCTPSR